MNEIWLNWYREDGSVFVMWIYHIPVVILLDPDMAKKALVTLNLPKAGRAYSKISHVFGQRAAGRGILTELDHEVWRQKRAMLNPAFHRKYLMNLMDAFNAVCDDFLENLRRHADGKTPVRMVDEFARVTLDIIGKVFCRGGGGLGLEVVEGRRQISGENGMCEMVGSRRSGGKKKRNSNVLTISQSLEFIILPPLV